jgi:hypothetical protein
MPSSCRLLPSARRLVLDEASLKTEMKCALLVHRSTHSRAFRLQSERAPPAILAKYPFLMVGICIAISIVVFVYIIVAIGCGAMFERCIDGGGFENTTMPTQWHHADDDGEVTCYLRGCSAAAAACWPSMRARFASSSCAKICC